MATEQIHPRGRQRGGTRRGVASEALDRSDTSTIGESGLHVLEIPLAGLERMTHPLRLSMDPESLEELAGSLTEHGLLEPVIVREVEGKFFLVAGFRRCAAAELLGWTSISASVIDAGHLDASIVSLVENVHRQDLKPSEEGLALENLKILTGWTDAELASKVGRDRSWVSRRLELRELPSEICAYVDSSLLPLLGALELRQLPDEGAMRECSLWSIATRATAEGIKDWVSAFLSSIAETQEGESARHAGASATASVAVRGPACHSCGITGKGVTLNVAYLCGICYDATVHAAREAGAMGGPNAEGT